MEEQEKAKATDTSGVARRWVMLDVGNIQKGVVRVAARPPQSGSSGQLVVRRVSRPPSAAEGRWTNDLSVRTRDLKNLVAALVKGLTTFLEDPDVISTLRFVTGAKNFACPTSQQKSNREQATLFLGHLLRWSHGGGEAAGAAKAKKKSIAAGTQLRLDVDGRHANGSKVETPDEPARWFFCTKATAVQTNETAVAHADARELPPVTAKAAGMEALGAWDLECWIGSNGLGAVARFVLLLEFLLTQYDRDLAEELQHDGKSPGEVLADLRKSLNRSSPPASVKTDYLVPWPLHRALADALNRLPCRSHLLSVIYTDLVQQPFGPVLGIDSVNAYRHWLRHGVTPFMQQQTSSRDQGINLDADRWCSSDGASVLDAIRSHIHDDHLGRPITVLHSVTRPSWLTKIATEVTRAPQDGIQRPVIWLRVANPDDANHVATVRAFIGPLCGAFGVTLWPETATPNVSQITKVLAALRGALWGTACVVVVDGVFNAGNTRIAALLDFLSDPSELANIIRGLATPPVDEAFAPDARTELDLSGRAPYCQTRFLVLSSQPCGALQPLTSKTFELLEDWLGGMRSDVLEASSEAIDAVRKMFHWTEDDEALYAGALATLSSPWVGKATVPFYAERESIWALLRTLRAHQSPLLMVLGFIAGSVDGMLHGSLHRTFGIWRGLVGADRPDCPEEVSVFCARIGGLIKGLSAGASLSHDAERVIPSTWAPDDFTDPAEPRDATLGCFMTCLGPLLSVNIEQLVEEGLGERQLRWEVGPIPGKRRASQGGVESTAQRKGSFRRGVAIWNPIVRDVIAEFFLRHEEPATTVGGLLGRPGWQLIHAASASELLRQGTALLRSAHAEDLSSLSRYRRIVQCLYHLLIAGELKGIELPGVDHDTFDHQSLFLPKKSEVRGTWAFVILLRSIVERHGAWRLTRHWARSELRTAILTQHMMPGHQPRFVPMSVVDTVLEESLSDEGVPTNANEAWDRLRGNWKSALAARPSSLGGLRMWNTFLTNIANAAVDSEDPRMASFASEQLKSVREVLDSVEALNAAVAKRGAKVKPRTTSDIRPTAYNFNFEKTIADLKDATGRPASMLAVVQLGFQSQGIAFDLGRHLQSVTDDIATLVIGEAAEFYGLDHEVQRAPNLLTKAAIVLRGALIELPVTPDLPADFLDGVDSMLSRHGSWLADTASKRPVTQIEARLRGLLKAWVTFYVADAIRDMVGKSDGARGKSFGYVSSRYWRVAIRTTLALARLLSRSNAERKIERVWFSSSEIEETVDWLLDHARARCDILVRDTHVFDRERMFAMLVQVSLVRTLAGVAKDRNLALPVIRSRLEDAIGYLSAAERRYIQLGSPPALARRYYVERIATLCAWIRFASYERIVDDRLVQRLACMTVNDLDVLDGHSAGNLFWEWLWMQRFRKFRSMCKELALLVEIPAHLEGRLEVLARREERSRAIGET